MRIQSNNRTRLLSPISLNVSCPTGESPSVNNAVLCIDDTVSQSSASGAAYRVTPGTLNGVLESAAAAVARRPTCGLTVNQLAAWLLSIGYHEIGSGTAGSAAPSPMTLGRADTYALLTSNLSWRSPLAAPFVAFTDDQMRFAVFPDSILDSLSGASDAVISTRYKAVPETANVRLQDYDWRTEDYGGAVLEVEICGDRDWLYVDENDRACAWAGVNDAGFASTVGVGG